MKTLDTLIHKYNVPGPRYTSYPTVPFWKEEPISVDLWKDRLSKQINDSHSREVSVYIHLPFCESLCTLCGCHKRITKNHEVEIPYLQGVKKEWELYLSLLGQLKIKELHLGGGTPTFFSPENLSKFLTSILGASSIESSSLSIEAHPNSTTVEHLKLLRKLGFNRISFGIQDYNPVVQKAIHRIQTYNQVKDVHYKAKKLGFASINHDLVYGLPFQTMDGWIDTINKTLELQPERIALYSYAHVPWIKGNGQRGFQDMDLPKNVEKLVLYQEALERLTAAGYISVGMDHFSLPSDELAIALKTGKLHRNFMGYTIQSTRASIGLGMSAISDSWTSYAQNTKSLEEYLESINKGLLPIVKGHFLTKKEMAIRKVILNLMCTYSTEIPEELSNEQYLSNVKKRLAELISDNLVSWNEKSVSVTSKGLPFIRNVCMAFDSDLMDFTYQKPLFSTTI